MSKNRKSGKISTEQQIEDLIEQLRRITLQLTQLKEQGRQERE